MPTLNKIYFTLNKIYLLTYAVSGTSSSPAISSTTLSVSVSVSGIPKIRTQLRLLYISRSSIFLCKILFSFANWMQHFTIGATWCLIIWLISWANNALVAIAMRRTSSSCRRGRVADAGAELPCETGVEV